MKSTDSGRRELLSAMIAASVTPWPALARQAASTLPVPGPSPVDKTEQKVASEPGQNGTMAAASDESRHLTVKVMLNGKGPYSFVVDTGSERTAVADDVAQALGLTRGAQVQVDGLARRITAETAMVDEFTFGPFKKRKLNVPVLPRAYLSADGYLGLDVIDGSRVVFDFRKRELRIERSYRDTFTMTRADVSKVQVYGPSGRLRASECSVDGVKASAFIDSGAEVSVGNTALYNALRRRNPTLPELAAIQLTGVTGGEITGRIVPVAKIGIQDLRFTDCTLVIAEVPNFGTWSLEREPAVLIGMDFMRQFASVAIDYRNKEIRFDLAGVTPPLSNRKV